MQLLHLNFKIQKFKGRKRNLMIKFQMYPRNLEVRQKNYLRSLFPKGDLLGTEKRYKKPTSLKLLLGLSKKA